MSDACTRDLITQLPENVIQIILTKLPIKDAVRTSILSKWWRFKWRLLKDLEFNDTSATHNKNRVVFENSLVKFVTSFLLLHNRPIDLFSLRTSYLELSPQVNQWIRFLSRKDIKRLVLELGEDEWYGVPSSLFSCKELRCLELVRCQLKKPPEFKPFLWLKYIRLQQVISPAFDVECVISSCPLLESLELSYFSTLLHLQIPSNSSGTTGVDTDFWNGTLPSDRVFHHLKTVEISDVLGLPRELHFAKYLLERSPELKSITIRLSPYVLEKILDITKVVTSYYRASVQAKFILNLQT